MFFKGVATIALYQQATATANLLEQHLIVLAFIVTSQQNHGRIDPTATTAVIQKTTEGSNLQAKIF